MAAICRCRLISLDITRLPVMVQPIQRTHHWVAAPSLLPASSGRRRRSSSAWTSPLALPATAHRGSFLSYTVTLTNRGPQDYRLDVCPDYSEFVGPKIAGGVYQLNCAPVGVISAGANASFAMQLRVPANAAQGTTQLTWALLDSSYPARTLRQISRSFKQVARRGQRHVRRGALFVAVMMASCLARSAPSSVAT